MIVFQNSAEKEWKDTLDLHVSIEITERNIFLLLQDSKTEKALALEYFSYSINDLKTKISESLIYSNSFCKTVSCVIVNTGFTLIPSLIFKEENVENYLDFTIQKKQDFNVKYVKLWKHDIFSCFHVSKKAENIISNLFPTVNYMPLENILIGVESKGFNVNFSSEKSIEIVYVKNTKLIFCNSFSFSNQDEMMYYVSLVCDKLKLKIEKEIINISGKIEKQDENYKFLKEFVPEKNIVFKTTNNTSKHKYYSLFKQMECE